MAGTRTFGIKVKIGANYVAGLKAAPLSGTSVNMIDVTAWDDTDGFKKFIAGLKDGGSLSLEYNVKAGDSGQLALTGGMGDEVAVSIEYPFGGKITGNAIIGATNTSPGFDDVLSYSTELKFTGEILIEDAA